MIQSIAISDIKPNPYQSRKELDRQAVKQLADSIKDAGFWNTTFRVRPHNGNFQLVFGHQRLAALKLLGQKKVAAELVDLDDLKMAEQSLIENLQRIALPEMDRAEGIARLVEMEINSEAGNKILSTHEQARARTAAVERVRMLLGYEHSATIDSFLNMAGFSQRTKEVLRKENTGREIARIAKGLGGEAMVRHAAREQSDVASRYDVLRIELG